MIPEVIPPNWASDALSTTAFWGLTAVSIATGLQGFSDRSDAVTRLSNSSREAEELFSSIKDQVYNEP